MSGTSLSDIRLARTADLVIDSALAVPFPLLCPVCGGLRTAPHSIACPTCLESLGTVCESVCTQCRRFRVFSDSECDYCGMDGIPRSVAVVALLDQAWRRIVHALKYRSDRSLAAPLSEFMTRCLPGGLAVDCIIPVPTDRHKRRERGYGHAELLAEGVAAAYRRPAVPNALEHTRRIKDQTRLRGRERQANLRGALRVCPTHDVIGQSVLLVDDITTTGATLAEAARALSEAGATSVLAVVLCLNLGIVDDGLA